MKLPSLPAPKSAAGTRLTISPSSSTAVSSTTTTAPARPTSSITNVPTTLPVTTTTTTGTGGGSAAPRLGADEAREQQSASNLVSASAPASTEQNVPVVVLQQLVTVRNEVDAARDVVDAARWAGDVHDASFIAGQLSLLHDHLSRGRTALRYRTDSSTGTGTGADADTQAKRTRTDGPDRASDGGTDTSDGGGSLDAEDDDDWAKPESLIDPNVSLILHPPCLGTE